LAYLELGSATGVLIGSLARLLVEAKLLALRWRSFARLLIGEATILASRRLEAPPALAISTVSSVAAAISVSCSRLENAAD
jgi:hypothetical protein